MLHDVLALDACLNTEALQRYSKQTYLLCCQFYSFWAFLKSTYSLVSFSISPSVRFVLRSSRLMFLRSSSASPNIFTSYGLISFRSCDFPAGSWKFCFNIEKMGVKICMVCPVFQRGSLFGLCPKEISGASSFHNSKEIAKALSFLSRHCQ